MSALSHVINRTYRASETVAWLVAGLGGAAFCIALAAAVAHAPAARALAERAQAEQIEQENFAFCAKYNMPAGTDAYRGCADDLREVRNREDARRRQEFDLP
jgi:hypothetical protein